MLSTCHQRSGHYASDRLHWRRSFFSLALLLTAAGCDAPTAIDPTLEQTQPVLEPLPGPAPGFTAKVIGIIDGYTVDVLLKNKTTIRLRFNAIDAPERGQPFGNNAKRFVSDQIFSQQIRIVDHGVDSYGRMIADLYRDGETISLNAALVHAGLAWHYTKYSDDPNLAAFQIDAATNKRGLWSDPRYVAPWDWRKLSKAERDLLR